MFFTYFKSSHFVSQRWKPNMPWHSRVSGPELYLHDLKPPLARSPFLECYHYCNRGSALSTCHFPHVREVNPSSLMLCKADPLFPKIQEMDPYDLHVCEAGPYPLCFATDISLLFRETDPCATPIARDMSLCSQDVVRKVLFTWLTSLLWPNFLPSFVGSRRSHSNKPNFIAAQHAGHPLCFVVVIISS